MIKETLDKNVEVKPNSKEIEMLKREFPQCFDKSGVFDIKIFEELIKTEDVEIKKEGYSLEFLGKSYARYLASLDSETIIVPDASNKNNDSENVYIIGDNLDALQHLKYSYANSIKCIYIDPPYNTGSDGFVYNDKFEFAAEELAKKIGIEEDEAERVLNMEGKSTHSAWLTFMYPRLELARDLLKEDGVIFISVDDNEHANIKRLCDEIFGESNFITSIVWRKKAGGANDSTDIAVEHEYIVCYKKKLNGIYKVPLSAERIKEYKYSDEKEETHGKYTLKNLNDKSLQDSKGLHFDIVCPDGTILYGKDNQWKCNEETFKQRLKDNRIVFNKKTDGEWICNYKIYLNEEKGKLKYDDNGNIIAKGRNLSSIIDNVLNRDGNDEIKELFGCYPFSYPKPSKLIGQLVQCSTKKDSIVLDFFSGSATTAHAVMQLNAEDCGNRKYIMVQLNETVKKGSEAEKVGYKTIDEIGRERIRRAADKIRKEEPEKSKDIDLRFKTYRLESVDKNTLDKIVNFDPNFPIDTENIMSKFGKDTIIETWKIKDGYGFNTAPKEIDLAGYTAYLLDDGKHSSNLYLLYEMAEESIIELVRQMEAFQLKVDKIIEYGYSMTYSTNTSLRSNLKTLKNKNSIDVIIRY